VDVGDRLLVEIRSGEERRQELPSRQSNARDAAEGGIRTGTEGRPGRVERRHCTTVTPPGNRRAPGITMM
jgi:hypothetical protein